jgi:hypothetical protein
MTDNEIILKIQEICMKSRGQILHLYTEIESIIDKIIFLDKELIFYKNLFNVGKLTSKVKSKIIKHYLENYDIAFIQNTESIRLRIDNITDKRDKFAHWILDLSSESVANFKKNGSVKLVKAEKPDEMEIFKSDTYTNLFKDTYDLRTQLFEVLYKVQDKNR